MVSGLVLNFVPDVSAAIAEMKRVARPGGHLASYVWDYGERMQMLRYFWEVATELDPRATDLDEGVRMVGEVVDVAGEEIEIGMPLRVDFREIDDDLTLPVWRKA